MRENKMFRSNCSINTRSREESVVFCSCRFLATVFPTKEFLSLINSRIAIAWGYYWPSLGFYFAIFVMTI